MIDPNDFRIDPSAVLAAVAAAFVVWLAAASGLAAAATLYIAAFLTLHFTMPYGRH